MEWWTLHFTDMYGDVINLKSKHVSKSPFDELHKAAPVETILEHIQRVPFYSDGVRQRLVNALQTRMSTIQRLREIVKAVVKTIINRDISTIVSRYTFPT